MFRRIGFPVCCSVFIIFLWGVLAAEEGKEPMSRGKTVSQWVELLKSQDPAERAMAANALEEIGPEAATAVPALTDALRDKEWEIRGMAASALGSIGPKAKDAMPALVEALKDRNDRVREVVPLALAQVGQGDAVPALTAALKDEAWPVRYDVVGALEIIGPQAKGVVPALVEALKDKGGGIDGVRNEAARTLKKFGPKAKEASPPLVEALHAPDDLGGLPGRCGRGAVAHRQAPGRPSRPCRTSSGQGPVGSSFAAAALCQLGSAGLPALRKALGDQDVYVRCIAAEAIGKIGPVGTPAVPDLIDALYDKSVWFAFWRPGTVAPAQKPGRHRDPGQGRGRPSLPIRQHGMDATRCLHPAGDRPGSEGRRPRSGQGAAR